MIQIQQIKLPVSAGAEELRSVCAHKLRCSKDDILRFQILKKSLDARKKPDLYYIYTVAVSCTKSDKDVLRRLKNQKDISLYEPVAYGYPTQKASAVGGKNIHPVVIGMGPAGLFCAYLLALEGLCPILLERGQPVEERLSDVTKFWETGILLPDSNVQFGEGGAGTFSDGKLNTLVKDKYGRNRFVLETFVKFGAPEQILYDQKPHIGTDLLVQIIANMREEILRLGGQVHFHSKVTGLVCHDGRLTAVSTDEKDYPCTEAVLAIGHSARDTFSMLHDSGVEMQAKEFAVGFRIEHPQESMNIAQYGEGYPKDLLYPASYKLATKLSNGRGVYSFCMCPGGYVVNASSEEHRLVVNGMSYHKRDSANANSAIVVSVGRGEYDMSDPLGAVAYQRQLEERAYQMCGGKIPQQLFGDFKQGRISSGYGDYGTVTRGDCDFGPLHTLLSEECNRAFLEGMELFGHKIKGFDRSDAILSGVESRTSSPVRIPRDDLFQSNIRGLYPCGEGAGYAGGIMSAAMDGCKVAEQIIEKYR